MFRRFRLDFADRQTEQEFKQGHEKQLLFSTSVACVASCAYWTLTIKNEVANEENQNPFDFTLTDLRTHRLLIRTLIYLVVPGCFLLAATLRLAHVSYLAHVDLEKLAVAIPTTICVMVPWVNRWTYAKLYGQDPHEIWANDMQQPQGLTLIRVFTGFCLFVPIRIHLLWMPVILGCLSWSVARIWMDSIFWDTITISGLGLCALKAARNNEQLSRQSWYAKKRVRAKSLELVQQCASTSRILERLCDCLVQLDEHFCIIDPSPRFSALLFCSNTEILKRANFCEYIASEQDRHLFVSELRKSASAVKANATDVGAAMVHVNLRDVWGRKFAVSVYHTVVYDLDGQCGHVLACIEGPDRGFPPNDTDLDTLALPLDSRLAHSTPSIFGASEGSSDSNSSVAMSTVGSEVAAWIDVASHDLEIVSCTTGFTQLRPIAAGTGLCCFLVGGKVTLKMFLEDCFNAHANDELESMISMPVCHIQLQPIPTVAMGYTAVVKPDFEAALPPSLEQQIEDSIEDRTLLRIVMSDLKYHRLKKTKRPVAGSKDNHQKEKRTCNVEVSYSL